MNKVEIVAGWMKNHADGCLVRAGGLDDRHAEEAIRALLANVITSQETQRRKIARELDDETAQTLTSVLLDLKTVEEAADLSGVRKAVSVLRASVSNLLQGVHHLAFGLRPYVLDDFGLEQALEHLAIVSSRRETFSVDLRLRGASPLRLPKPIEIALYRITEEALTNASTHALAKSVSVLLYRNETTVHLVIEDDGRGFEAATAPARQLRLVEMRERAQGLGGSMTVRSSVRRGTTVCISVPLPEARPALARWQS
ncbi:MAG: signal transduction histidine kinase [Myxococcales bacterium]|nr:signal transduction histidine kinase [Myxococcales bacterium]